MFSLHSPQLFSPHVVSWQLRTHRSGIYIAFSNAKTAYVEKETLSAQYWLPVILKLQLCSTSNSICQYGLELV